MKKFLIEKWNLLILIIATSAIIIIRVLGYMSDGIVPSASLGMLLAFSVYQIAENLKIQKSVNDISEKSPIAHLRVIRNTRDFYVFASAIVEQAKVSIEATYFTPYPPTKFFDDKEIKRYWDRFSKILRERSGLVVRRIATIENAEKFEWAEAHVDQSRSISNYSFAVLENPNLIPILNVMVIDGKSAFIFVPHGVRSRHYLWIDDLAFCEGVQEYFDHLWSSSVVIKEGPRLQEEKLEYFRTCFSPTKLENAPALIADGTL